MNRLWQDIHDGLRALKHNPRFIAAAVLALGLSVGVNTAIFSAVGAGPFDPLPCAEPNAPVRARVAAGLPDRVFAGVVVASGVHVAPTGSGEPAR